MLAGVLIDDRETPWSELTGQEMGGFPMPVLRAIKDDTDQEHDLISGSQIAGSCLRAAYLKHTVPYFEEPGRRIPLIIGTFAHALLEKSAPEDALTEVVLQWTTPDGIRVTGHADLVLPAEGLLQDWKTARWVDPAKLPYGTHEAQVNVYRWMLEHNEVEPVVKVNKLQVVYIDLTGPNAKTGHNGVVVVDIEMWSDRKVKNFITQRAAILNTAQERGIVPPMVEKSGRWACRYCSPRIEARCYEEGE